MPTSLPRVILRWHNALRKNGKSKRTIYKKHVFLFGFLKWCGVSIKPLAERASEFTEKNVRSVRTQETQEIV